MKKLLSKYWVEVIALAVIATVLLVILPNGWTWMNTDSDGAHYTMAAKYFTTAHHTSAPLYLLLGHLFLQIPFMSEAWRMGLISVFATIGACIFIYFIVKELLWNKFRFYPSIHHDPKVRWLAILSMIIYGGSALAISQSTIVETYSLITMLGLAGYYFCLKSKWTWASIFFGLGLAIHPLIGFTWVVMFVDYKEMRNWKRWGITILFLLFYLYIPIVKLIGHDNGMWANTSASGFFEGTWGAILMLTGGLSVWDFPQRALNTILILLASVGLGIIPAIYYLIKKKTWHNSLLWLTLIPIIYFATDLAAETYVYVLPSIAYLSILAALGLSKLNVKWIYATGFVAIILLSINTVYFKNLDPDMSAMKFYHDLDKIPDGQYFMGTGWNWAMVYVYNKEESRNIIPIMPEVSPSYRKVLDGMGIKYIMPNPPEEQITQEGKIALSIVALNDNVWIAKETKPEVYQYEIVPGKGNEDYIGRWIGQEIKPEWRLMPSNPWSFVSGKLEVREWNHVLRSNRNMLRVMAYSLLGYMLLQLVIRKKTA